MLVMLQTCIEILTPTSLCSFKTSTHMTRLNPSELLQISMLSSALLTEKCSGICHHVILPPFETNPGLKFKTLSSFCWLNTSTSTKKMAPTGRWSERLKPELQYESCLVPFPSHSMRSHLNHLNTLDSWETLKSGSSNYWESGIDSS